MQENTQLHKFKQQLEVLAFFLSLKCAASQLEFTIFSLYLIYIMVKIQFFLLIPVPQFYSIFISIKQHAFKK